MSRGVEVEDRARLAGDGVGGRDLGVAPGGREDLAADIRPSQKSETTAWVVQPSADVVEHRRVAADHAGLPRAGRRGA